MNTSFQYYVLAAIILLSTACSKEDSNEIEGELTNKETNEWIYKVMDEDYLWYEDLPAKGRLDINVSPDVFFESLLSTKDGVIRNNRLIPFSYIEKKQDIETKAISEKRPTYGFEFAAYNVVDQGGVPLGRYYVQILYVMPDSPAEKVGLQRGDWIFGINGETENITDYMVLTDGPSIKLWIGKFNGDRRMLTLPASVTLPEASPFLKETVIRKGNKNIGYLHYLRFASGSDGRNDDVTYDNQMREIFHRFKSQQINEFVLDLRYNGGGLISCAKLLASHLVPAKDLGKTFLKLEYNKKNTKSENYLFEKTLSGNLNLSRLYVLIGQNTASSSEAVINGLIPYLGVDNVVLIGETTLGKTVGSQTYGERLKYEWLLHPITLKVLNKDGNADYINGFDPTPGCRMDELEIQNTLYPLGDERELLLAKALSLITGNAMRGDVQTHSPATGLKPVYISLLGKKPGGMILDFE